MKYIADLHIHSRYSRATSREAVPEHLDFWARKKGIAVVGTGDFTHPEWRRELAEKLEPAEDGLYRLKEEYIVKEARKFGGEIPRFAVSGEISSIYKKNGKTRKVHSLILLPGLEDAERLAKKLEAIGNIHSDGRPILGLDCRELLEIMLDICPEGIMVPAHIWTPHFSLFGAFSGFDRIEECFEDLTPYIRALETGLSSDPPMNGRWSALDRYQLISNSDAHSPGKLGREATLLDTDMSYGGLFRAIQEGKGLAGTIEFFPEEGKYHFDGHRKCHVCLSPEEAEKYQGTCPVCGRKLTVGVDHRIVQLADRKGGSAKEGARPFESLVPLPEVIAASTGKSASSKKVQKQYEEMLVRLGTEFEILRQVPEEDICTAAGTMIAEGIRRLRAGKVKRIPGFDGEYGTISLFEQDELENLWGQMSFFSQEEMKRDCGLEKEQPPKRKERGSEVSQKEAEEIFRIHPNQMSDAALNSQQTRAVEAVDRAVTVIAGPGTGKTKTLVARIRYLLEVRKVKPSEITAVTFTNLAAGELRERLAGMTGCGKKASRLHIGTFHSICMELLQKSGREILLAPEEAQKEYAARVCSQYGLSVTPGKFLQWVSAWKTGDAILPEPEAKTIPEELLKAYQSDLDSRGQSDFDDLLLEVLRMFENSGSGKMPQEMRRRFNYILVDEFQDISPLQYRLVKAWNEEGRELFAIGDPDQSIYGFRGADAGCFEHIKEDFPDVRIISLTENYRTTEKILNGAGSLIFHNGNRARVFHSHQGPGIPVRIVETDSKMSEAVFTAKEITRLIGGIDMLDAERQSGHEEGKDRSFRDIAVLYRTHYQARLLEKTLSREGIPYVVHGREDFLEKPLVRGTVNFFLSLIHQEPMYKSEAIRLLWGGLNVQGGDMIYSELTEKYASKWKRTAPRKLLEEWICDLGQGEDKNLKMFAEMAVLYKKMPEFLNDILMGEEGDLRRCNGREFSPDAVQLMTLHGSKGLEFPVVFLYGTGKGEIPLENEKHPADPQEERRLLFVGMTRAREELIMTYAKEPSPFLEEIHAEYAKREKNGKERKTVTGIQMSLFDFLA